MRWNKSDVAFSRPIRWFLALHGGAIVPFTYAGYTSGRETRGLRFEGTERVEVSSTRDYFDKMRLWGILLDPEERKAEIQKQAEVLAADIGGQIPGDLDLLNEVTNMVEKPTAFQGVYDNAYLEVLPPEVLISVMKKHQRYFVVEDKACQLMPYFIGIRNGGGDYLDVVADGNEQVIRARFDDAVFFVEKDLHKPLEEYVEDLHTLTFQVELGSYLDKTHRITQLVKSLAPRLGLLEKEAAHARRAAGLCKADLATNMVVEMTSLQGVMGRYYALHSGEDPAVADAIFEHYLPRSAQDRSPQTKPGLVVGLADRLDSLMGLFAVGLAPTGTKDPFAQRRAAVGMCQNLIAWKLNFDLHWGLEQAAGGLAIDVNPEVLESCFDFILGRLRIMLLEQGSNFDVVDAVLAEKGHDPYGAFVGAGALSAWVEREDWDQILPAFSRCVRITRDLDETFAVDEDQFVNDEEQLLYTAIRQAERDMTGAKSVDAFLNAFMPMVPVINRFFDEVLVMAEEEALRENRLALLQRVSALSDGIADLSYLEGF